MVAQLIVNADDFGLTPGVNRGILEAHEKGIVTSTSLMANTPGFDDAVRLARITPDLGVGFHFNLTYGVPLSPPEEIPSLVDEHGRFFFDPQWRGDISRLGENWRPEDIQKELAAQWARVSKSGLTITHIDSHHFIQNLPHVYAPLAELARKEGLPMRHTFRFPKTPDEMKALKHLFSSRETLPSDHPVTTERFIADFYYQEDGLDRLIRHLSSMEEGTTEINCHPGYVDEILPNISNWTEVREKELKVLTDESVLDLSRAEGIRFIHYGQLTE